MLTCFAKTQKSIPIAVLAPKEVSSWLAKQATFINTWLKTNKFSFEPGSVIAVPDETGKVTQVLYCIAENENFWNGGSLPQTLPEGIYHAEIAPNQQENFAIAWGLGAYQFTRYKKPRRQPAQLVLPKKCDVDYITNMVESIYFVRDLINTPTDDMGPSELAQSMKALAHEYKATFTQIMGRDLEQNYPCIYTVGRASDDEPRLLDLRWGNKKHPKITLIGKGVCFDTGGLDIKPAAGMLLMKKDMAGAANVLGLARLIMEANLPIRLRVLIPAVENAISGNAYRPGDVIKSRSGITVEIGNTDAEGRVVLADALTEAVSEKPHLIIDVATLTGAARVALGTEISALFTNNDKIANDLNLYAQKQCDPIWRLPLFSGYRDALNSTIADINNTSPDSYAGAITAALFLKEFVPDTIPWMHFDLMAWNVKYRPGRPVGGEAMAIRALFSYLSSNNLATLL